MSECPFCILHDSCVVWSNELAIGFRDSFPVSKGHTLVATRRHVASYFEASSLEKQGIWEGVEAVKAALDAEFSPDGYNVGFNSGGAAGQTIDHLHIHVIPRFAGDVENPRGGVRGAIPHKRDYDSASQSAESKVETLNPFRELPSFCPGEESGFGQVLRKATGLANKIDLLAAFVQKSGLDYLEDQIVDALNRGATVRLLTGDYLGITHPHALSRLYTLSTQFEDLSVHLYRVQGSQSFHPKAYIFTNGIHGVAFVGSSNLSFTALHSGVEWNLKTTLADGDHFHEIRERFDGLFGSPPAVPLTVDVLKEYQGRVKVPPAPEPSSHLPLPRQLQKEVLEKIAAARDEGISKGLVVMATGLGKTYLSAFDFQQHGGKRALFVAHREEILQQAAGTWSQVFPDATIGFLVANRREPEAELVFASVQTLSRLAHLSKFDATHFDYIVIDEFHHAAANSYKKLLSHFSPQFMLGLTATPNRTDGKALLSLCDGNLIVSIGLAEGISRGELVPFHYFGVKDGLDFTPIPWRNGKFSTQALTEAKATKARALQALTEYRKHTTGSRPASLIFCCSRLHADFMAEYFTSNGVTAASVHSGASSDPRAESLEKLRDGSLEAICAVDVFNEGVDLPDVNTIMMLRPTESPIVFMQQLGRGLRKGARTDKPYLTVVDFIGNHRSFLSKPQALVALLGRDVPPGAALERLRNGELELPEGCSVEIETEALEMLERVANLTNADKVIHTYSQLCGDLGRRPTAIEALRAGINFNVLRTNHGTWFDLLDSQNDLGEEELNVLRNYHEWFTDLTKTRMTRSYKMVALKVLLDGGKLHGSMPVSEVARRSHAVLNNDPILRFELNESLEAGDGEVEFEARWREMPLRIFHDAQGFSRQWFGLEGTEFRSRLDVHPDHQSTFDEMTDELIALRLEDYISRNRFIARIPGLSAPLELAVSHSNGKPILRFDRDKRPEIPKDEVNVHVGGKAYSFRFVKIACNVVTEFPGGPNVLPELMRTWFGPTAGHPGTKHRVELQDEGDGSWSLRKQLPVGDQSGLQPLGTLPFYPDLRVACGLQEPQEEGHDRQEWLPVSTEFVVDRDTHFVIQASGNSMNGSDLPIADGDLVLCEHVSPTDPTEIEGVPMVLTSGSEDETTACLKIPIRQGGEWILRSSNSTFPDMAIAPGETLRPVARVLEVVEQVPRPVIWQQYDRNAIAAFFGETNTPSWKVGHRDVVAAGVSHSVLMITLRKPVDTPLAHRYADKFLSPSELQWESQSKVTPDGIKAQRLIHQEAEGRQVHLFVRYHPKNDSGKGEPFTYCGLARYLRHESESPVRMWFSLATPLPRPLWDTWSKD